VAETHSREQFSALKSNARTLSFPIVERFYHISKKEDFQSKTARLCLSKAQKSPRLSRASRFPHILSLPKPESKVMPSSLPGDPGVTIQLKST
jgi:hypothetical protein